MQTETATPGLAAVPPAPTFSVPHLATVEKTAELFRDAGITPLAIRAYLFRADDRHNSRGELLPGNGLGRTGAIVRRGRKILLDVPKFAAWLGASCSN